MAQASGWVGSTVAINFIADTVTTVQPTASNGTTPVSLVAAVAAKRVYVVKVFINNTDTAGHTVTFQSTTGPTGIFQVYAPALSCTIVDDDTGALQTAAGDGLQFHIEAAGTSVSVNGCAVQK